MTSKSDSWSGSKLIILTHSHGAKSQWDCWVGMLNVEADVESGLGIRIVINTGFTLVCHSKTLERIEI